MLKKEAEIQRRELKHKTQELSLTNHYLKERNNMLNDLQSNLQLQNRDKNTPEAIIKVISEKIHQSFVYEEAGKQRFKVKFDDTQRDYITILHKKHTSLSNAECRVCALLRSGLDTNEIAHILSTSARTIENHRVSIRRKMNLTRNDNLNRTLALI